MKRARDPEALREAINERKFSYRQLGKLADCSHTTPYLLVQGKATSNEIAGRIARALLCDLGVLFVDAVSNDEQRFESREAVA